MLSAPQLICTIWSRLQVDSEPESETDTPDEYADALDAGATLLMDATGLLP